MAMCTSRHAPLKESWVGFGSTSIVPPTDYWNHLDRELSCGDQIRELQQLSDQRLNEFRPGDLHGPANSATELLDKVVADRWLENKQRWKCPTCSYELNEAEGAQTACPECGEAFVHHGGIVKEIVYARKLAPVRAVDWVVAIHGMNTAGAWQESFTWHLGTTWGRSVPVAVYKYGIVIAGVIMAWRRRKLQRKLRAKLATLSAEANVQGFTGKPDVIAHSFGTWLFGHLLQDELRREESERLKFGRVILTGCVLRPDFDWRSIQSAGLVEEVLNHYGTKDPIVPLAHITIWDSGPSGRRGFDGDHVINVRAEGYGPSDLFSIEKCVVNDKHLQQFRGAPGETRNLDFIYRKYWRPFLTLPVCELGQLPDRSDPNKPWRQLPWLLRGTVFPFFMLPFVLSLVALLLITIGVGARFLRAPSFATHALSIAGSGLALLIASVMVVCLFRRVKGCK
jgi:hypothetical protein